MPEERGLEKGLEGEMRDLKVDVEQGLESESSISRNSDPTPWTNRLTNPTPSTSTSTSAPISLAPPLYEPTTSTPSSSRTITPRTIPPKVSPELSPTAPKPGFTFGSLPTAPPPASPPHTSIPSFHDTIPPTPGTPQVEYGPFEYPSPESRNPDSPRPSISISSSSQGPSRKTSLTRHQPPTPIPLQLGQTHRRSSIVGNTYSHTPYHPRQTSIPQPQPPPNRRSSTTSELPLLPPPRPSILHSSTIPLIPDETPPNTTRRPSLLFPQKPLNSPIPPSLLARRGSLPASQLFGLPSTTPGPSRLPPAMGYTTTTPALYHRSSISSSRRGSVMSDGTSGSTVTSHGTERERRRSDVINDSPTKMGEGRRSSVPFNYHSPLFRHPQSPNSSSQYQHQNTNIITNPYRQRFSSASTRSGLSNPSLSSSSEEEEEEEDEVLPTPGTAGLSGVGGMGMFSDPWSGGKEVVRRPGLETINSDDTERG